MVSDNYLVRFISSLCRLVRYWRKCQLVTETYNFLLMSSCVKPSNTKLKLVSLSCKIYISIKVKRLCTNQLAWNKNCFTSRHFFLSQLSIPWDLINHFRQYLENPISFTPTDQQMLFARLLMIIFRFHLFKSSEDFYFSHSGDLKLWTCLNMCVMSLSVKRRC